MRRSTTISAFFSLLRAGSTGAIALAAILSCSDSTGPRSFHDDAVFFEDFVPDSLKLASLAQPLGNGTLLVGSSSADILAAPRAAFSSSVASGGYTVSHVEWNPESIPEIWAPDSVKDDGWIGDVNLGFDFNFYGKNYSTVNVYSNGFLMFGQGIKDPRGLGFNKGGPIPSAALPNNIIAFAWMDWVPDTAHVKGGIRWARRGVAPNRRFVLQFNNVPEYAKFGKTPGYVLSQVVLTEGSNEITIYTYMMYSNTLGMTITQGIENADGTKALWGDSVVVNAQTGAKSSRVQAIAVSSNGTYRLDNDAIRFSPPGPPRVAAPANIVVPTTPPATSGEGRLSFASGFGTCDAAVNPGVASATGNSDIVSLVGVRSDDATLALDAPYKKGVTQITWTATDADGLVGSAIQTVTVVDKENPLLAIPADLTADNDPGLPSAVVAAGSASAEDNCHEVTVSSARSDGAASGAPYMVGLTKITWTAADPSGNIATAVQSITVKDVEAPSLTAPASYTVDATSPSGVIVNFSMESHDNVAVSSLACTPLSGTRLPIGENPITCTAYDAAGNHTSASFVVTVTNAPIQTRNLIAEIQALGLSDGLANPLINQLLAALDGDGNACKKMDDFLDLLSKKGGAEISVADMASFRLEAIRICNVMACPPSAKRGAKPQLSPSGT
ncbi:MAG: HYR domain-containing protein [Gemmatimonadota bacterium]|nr:HYR domain-containing protein [Gemmatimonadota bacterium]